MAAQIWTVVAGTCGTHGAEGIPTYGVQVTYADCTWTWADVDLDPAVAQRLADRLNRVQPAPCHFADMVLDFIQECAAAEL